MIDKKKNIEFGIVLSLILVIVSAYCRINLTVVVVIALVVTLLIPVMYTPFTWLWFRLGDLLSLVITRCVLYLLFFLIITPIGIFRRLMKKDPFRLKQFGKSSESVFCKQEKAFRVQDLEKQY